MQICPKVGLKFCHILNKSLKNCPRLLNILPKWRKFAKSGHTGRDEGGEENFLPIQLASQKFNWCTYCVLVRKMEAITRHML